MHKFNKYLRWIYQNLSHNSRDSISYGLSRKDEEYADRCVRCLCIEKSLNSNDLGGHGGSSSGRGHYQNCCMLFVIERVGVQPPTDEPRFWDVFQDKGNNVADDA